MPHEQSVYMMETENFIAAKFDPVVFADKIMGLDIQPFHAEWLNALNDYSRLVVTAPRGHGKCCCEGAQVQLLNGKTKKIEECQPGDQILSLASDNKIVPSIITQIIDNGIKETYQIALASGRITRVTKNHPFFTARGWQSIGTGLQEKDRLVVPRQIARQGTKRKYTDAKIRILAYLIAEGGLTKGNTKFTNCNKEIQQDMGEALYTLKSEMVPLDSRPGDFRIRGINNPRGKQTRLLRFLKKEGIYEKYAYEKQVPSDIFCSPKEQIRLFLSCLWRCDGTINVNHRGTVDISYSTSSKILAQQVQTLLTFFGINTSIYSHKTLRRLNYQVVVIGSKTNRLDFLANILEQKEYPVRQILEKTKEHSNIDTIPYDLVKNTLEHTPWQFRKKHGIRIDTIHDVSQNKLKRLIGIESTNKKLKQLKDNDIRWDTIKSIEHIGKKQTFGLEVKRHHNHIIDGIVSHNTTIFGVTFPLWICAYQKNKTILIVSNTMDQSKLILKEIKNTMLSNEHLQVLVPQDSNASWTKTEIDTESNCTILVRPNTQNVRGVHADYIICDEISLFDDKDVFVSAISQAVQPTTKIAAIGTPMTDQDLLADLMRNEKYHHLEYSALDPKTNEALWEARYGRERLNEIKIEIGALSFEREYMCKKIPLETQLLPIETLERNFLPRHSLGSPVKRGIYFIGCDLAISQKKSADYTVFTIIEQDEQQAIIRDIHRMQGAHIQNQKLLLTRLCHKYNPQQILLDQSTFGEAMVQELRMEGLPVRGYSFAANSRLDLLNNLVSLFDADKIKIPRNRESGRTMQLTDILIDELTALGTATTNTGQLTYKSFGRHPDISMSLALAVKPLKHLRRSGHSAVVVTDSGGKDAQDDGLFVLRERQPKSSSKADYGLISIG